MPLRPECVGETTEPIVHRYDWRDVVTYALAVGAKADTELPFLYEGFGPKVLPFFGVIPAFEAFDRLFKIVDGDMMGVVHGSQHLTRHAPIHVGQTLTTVGRVNAIYDLRRLAVVVFSIETRNEDGEIVCDNESEVIFRNDGDFGGERMPRRNRYRTPKRSADFEIADTIGPEQALLYRLTGDLNPLHADPEVAAKAGFRAPILHGLCTFGYVGRALFREACNLEPHRLRSFRGKFSAPVWPGETLITRGWVENTGVFLEASTRERPDETCFSEGFAELTDR